MAFIADNFSLARGTFNSLSNSGSARLHTYTTNDIQSVVETNGYFDDLIQSSTILSTPTIQIGDLIYINYSSLQIYIIYLITSNVSPVIVEQFQTAGEGFVISVNGRTGIVSLSKSDVGLSNVDNIEQIPLS